MRENDVPIPEGKEKKNGYDTKNGGISLRDVRIKILLVFDAYEWDAANLDVIAG